MQPASDGPEPSNNLKRYGPLGVIVVLLVVIGAVVVLSGGDDDDDETATDDTTTEGTEGGAPVTAGAPAPTGEMPITYAEAEEAGTVDDYTWPDTCDTETGFTRLPTTYGTPCVPEFEGDNGGATSNGVTADTITVVRYVPDQSADLSALLGSFNVDDTPEAQGETLRDYIEIFSSTAELYGREIEVIDYQGTGAADDVVAAKADATQVLAEHDPFAVIGAPALDRGTFAEELASNGVICLECGTAMPDAVVQEHAGYIWGALPSVNQYLGNLNAWVAAGGATSEANAEYAGDEAYHDQPRKVGVVHFEQDPPIFQDTAEENAGSLENVLLREPYLLDFATMPTKATEIMAKFKQEGITTVVFLGDPIMPIYLTQAATEQEYFPEWIFTGTVLTDTNVMARQFDPTQMEHAFGISQLAVPTNQELQENILLYRWWTGDDEAIPPSEAQYNLIAPRARFLVNGIHMAGPDLNPETYEQGMFRIPPAGGSSTLPQVSFGNWGFFPEPDYMGIDDSSEIWWDGATTAQDERGEEGPGVWRRSRNGDRFTAVDAPEPRPFIEEDTVTVLEELPEEAVLPEYPPPPGSPAAGG